MRLHLHRRGDDASFHLEKWSLNGSSSSGGGGGGGGRGGRGSGRRGSGSLRC